ncbi:NfeD family protein [Caldimonas thermodepolymerans]|jgi:membrane protein implicated in regulation of membrane protease activity|uniref:Membrane protein implicated in regulation of membrane protease activity n=1 Tax=Caldimonas thermodepolymerans TaxID=215580 RepID=A0A2S5T7F5_9BURK|nr:NfeD family protein [Caldimonas thermodepolymerans]PPE70886.1 hypothetical protein C1702_04955 [Caldimonas thermodepolymerans]QPC33110.1 NfeD family protein [Caldimonas thermodepolymerans]RDI03898.1 membrane protein implicated in regulation of membrane protease activity [Caldimonas thermodepolymerans]TCP09869.1 membrane protein implicated in regulation of membrane protease activity [Caldimonas thermodepolymerans]UZG45983.1 NfeD family protein [Caldimonas thermodepolymerans]
MDFGSATWWWVLAGIAVAAELATGTFYLLMLALGLAGGALAAHAGLSLPLQVTAAAIIGGGAVAAWRVHRKKQPPPAPVTANPELILDIGQRVHVSRWGEDRTARVMYRGAQWTARYGDADLPQPGEHVIRAVEGNILIVRRPPE